MTKKFLLVCEGKTDFFILDQITSGIANKTGNSIEIIPISPKKDATSGSFPRHGWTEVQSWCKAFSIKPKRCPPGVDPKAFAKAKLKNWLALVVNSSADGLIVQMDADIADQISDVPPLFAASPKSRKEYCKDAIMAWLNQTSSDPRILCLVPTFCTETWVLATYPRNDAVFSDLKVSFKFDEISDAQARLVKLGLQSNKGALVKSEENYREYGNRIFKHLGVVENECGELKDFLHYI